MEGVELYLHSSITSALNWLGGQHHAPAPLFPGKKPPILNEYDAGWVREPVWTLWIKMCEKEHVGWIVWHARSMKNVTKP